MTYRLLNKLFGWDYIYWQNICAHGIARIHKASDGTVYYYRYKTTKLIDKITNQKQVIWLTCNPEKYIT